MSNTGRSLRRRPRQRGSTVVFAIVTLVAFTLAALALLRSVDTSAVVLGNVGFKQEALAAGEAGSQAALDWLSTNGSALGADGAAGSGYFARVLDGLDPTGGQVTEDSAAYAGRTLIDWDGDSCAYGVHVGCVRPSAEIKLSGGLVARYLVTRLCTAIGAPADVTNNCAAPWNAGAVDDSNMSVPGYGDGLRIQSKAGPYYRVIVRVRGTRDAVSFTETIVHF